MPIFAFGFQVPTDLTKCCLHGVGLIRYRSGNSKYNKNILYYFKYLHDILVLGNQDRGDSNLLAKALKNTAIIISKQTARTQSDSPIAPEEYVFNQLNFNRTNRENWRG